VTKTPFANACSPPPTQRPSSHTRSVIVGSKGTAHNPGCRQAVQDERDGKGQQDQSQDAADDVDARLAQAAM